MRNILILLISCIALPLFIISADAAVIITKKTKKSEFTVDLVQLIGPTTISDMSRFGTVMAVHENDYSYIDMVSRGAALEQIQIRLIDNIINKWNKGDISGVRIIFYYLENALRECASIRRADSIDFTARMIFGDAEWEKTQKEVRSRY